MRTTRKLLRVAVPVVIVLMAALLSGCSGQMLVMDPKGPVGEGQRDLIVISMVLCGIILVPVLLLTAYIVWKYRDNRKTKANYQPNWSHSTVMEVIWWSIPIVIIAVLAVVTGKYTYALEPSKPLASEQKAITVQVASLDWKWLFIYPDEGIASVNTLQIPTGTPVRFELTSDSAMNSFWIPQLGGQIYTMSGMAMTLYLQADEAGVYFGSGANFTGEHFADMKFDVNATSRKDFDKWVTEVKRTSPALTEAGYQDVRKPGTMKPQLYSSFPDGLFDKIVMQYSSGQGSMNHGGKTDDKSDSAPMNMDDMDNMDMGDMSHMDMSGGDAADASGAHAAH